MEQRQRLFIYDRREMLILVALGIMVAAFAFTLGVHLGKKVTSNAAVPAVEVSKTATLQDNLPNRQELTEQTQVAQSAADEELSHTLHEEVEKTGIRLKTPRQVDLPTATRSKSGGATTLTHEAITPAPNQVSPGKAIAELNKAAEKILPAHDETPNGHGKFTLQIGSFPSPEEAKSKMDELRAQGLTPYVRSAQVKGLGRRFRLFVGDFSSREDAEKAGRKYQSERMIESYLINHSE